MPLSHAFMQSIENGDWLAWSALIAGVLELVILAAIVSKIVRKV